MEALLRLLQGATDVPDEVDHAYYIYQDEYQREIVDTLLLAETPLDEIEVYFEIPEAVTTVYKHLFFDLRVFRNRLDRVSYARNYVGSSEFGSQLKLGAVEYGKDYVLSCLAKAAGYNVDPVKAVKESVTMGYVLSKNALEHAVDSSKAKEARQWASTMNSAIQTLSAAHENSRGQDRDLLIKLQLIDYDRTTGSHGMPQVFPEDIVHKSEDDS